MQNFNSILLVDDDDSSNFLSKRIINNLNICNTIYIAENGKEAIDLLNEKCNSGSDLALFPNVILLDINMPVMDGFEFLHEFSLIKNNIGQEIKIIILTSSNNMSDIKNAQQYNTVSGYLNKPITKEKLLQILE